MKIIAVDDERIALEGLIDAIKEYKYDDLFKRDTKVSVFEEKNATQLVEYKDSKWKNFINKI